MRALLCVLLTAACVLADDNENRRSKLPYIADAVGNTLPPPSNGPATVGSPVNLLTPDRYEFYTFDESGELVKRLMTLEEIQAIVAAGEETEGLVTFANENQPTIAFNFSQPPYTKVHSVVTNVQNVLKAQMEAHKKNPMTQPTLDTPDVSDSWSLILPSIFGNTGVDIVPDKMSGTFTTPETETIDVDRPVFDNSLSKEGTNQILSSTSTKGNVKEDPVTEKMASDSFTTEKAKVNSSTTTSTSTTKPATAKPLSTPTSAKPTSTATKITITTTKPTTTTAKSTTATSKPTTVKLLTTTTTITTTSTTTSRPRTSSKPRTTTTFKPTTKVIRTTPKPTTAKPSPSTKKTFTTQIETEQNFTKIHTFTNSGSATNKNTVQYEKVSTFVPLSTAAYVTERSTQKPVETTKAPVLSTTKRYLPTSTRMSSTIVEIQPSITTYKPSTSTSSHISSPKDEVERFTATTVTTQSVSPSTTISSTVSVGHHKPTDKNSAENDKYGSQIKEVQPEINFFDVAQSFSQIASDLGNNFQPIPTSSDLLDTTKLSDMNLESKENVEIEIPAEIENPVGINIAPKIENSTKRPENIQKPIKNENFVASKVDKPTETEKPTIVQQVSEIEKPVEIKTINATENFTKTDKTVVEKSSNKHTENFVKISTLEPHQNENKIVTVNSNSKLESKTTTSSSLKLEITTGTTPLISTTIDPVLSESMEDLFSQIVNQAPQSVFNTQLSSSNQESMSEASVNLEKENKLEKTEITVQELKTQNEPDKTDEQKSKNMTNDILQVTTEIIEVFKDGSENPKQKDYISTNITQQQQSIENKHNSVNNTEPTVKKQEQKTESSSPIVTQDLNMGDIQDRQKNSSDVMVKENKTASFKPFESTKKEEEVAKVSTTTESLTDLELTNKLTSTIKKPAGISSNANKIALPEHNKIANTKYNEKLSEESEVPKVDEFKKKIQKVNIDDKELVNERNNSWKLISTVSPPKANEIPKDKDKSDSQEDTDKDIVLDFSKENQGLEVTTKDLGEDIAQFTELCNELAFRYWQTMTESIEKRRSFILSPYSITSMLAMMFMGARGATSGEMNEILKLDDMVTFNPHFTLKNISDSIETTSSSGVIVSAFVRELFSDRSKGKILTFYKERAQHFYNGHVEEINFKLISDIIRRRTNLLVKRYTWGRIAEYMKSNTITMQPPLAAFSANIFQTDCSGSSVEGRDGEMYFVVSPNVRQRRLVPVPAVVYRSGFLAGYDPGLDATAAALGNTNSVISTLFLMPGQQGNVVHAEDLEALEKRLLDSNPTTPAWNRLLRTLLPRIGLELQIPRFSHKSIFNVSTTLQKMGLKELFDPEHADLGGLNGPSKDLYLSDMVQSTTFVTCGEGVIGEQHHVEEYPEALNGPQRRRTSRWVTGWDEPRDYQRAFHDPHDVGEAMNLPLHLRPRQARLPSRNAQPARLKFDRPFLYFVRHNPSGMILYVGRYNPRLLP